MFRASWAALVIVGMGLAGSASAATYTVGQSGQTYTTVTAAFAAALAAVGDTNPIIEIHDNNGGLGYSSATRMDLTAASNRNITITALVAVRIVCTANQEVLRNSSNGVLEQKISVIGASAAAPITLANTFATNTIELISCNNTTSSSTWNGLLHLENVVLEKPANGTGPFARPDSVAVGQHVLKNVTLSGGSASNGVANILMGPRDTDKTASVSMESVSFASAAGATGMISLRNRVNLEAKSCTFRVPVGSNQPCVRTTSTAVPVASTGGSQVIFRDCSFESGTSDAFTTLGETGHTTRNVYKLYRPTFFAVGTNLFAMDDRPVEIYVLGLDDSDLPTVPKVNLGTIPASPTLRYARLRGNNKVSFQYCTGSDTSGGTKYIGNTSGAYNGNPEVELRNCELRGTGLIVFNSTTGAFAPVVNMRNCVIRAGSFSFAPVIENSTADISALAAQINLTHCTFTGNTGAYFNLRSADLLSAPGSILNGPGTATIFAGTLQPSVVPTLSWNSSGLSGITSTPPNHIVANPGLNSTGRLTTASTAAFNQAATGLVSNDIDNDARPLPAAATANDLGADEAAFPVTDLALAGNTVSDLAANATLVGTFTITDPDNDSTLTLTDDGGGAFGVSGNTLVVANNAVLDGVSAPTVNVTVLATDLGGATYSESFSITVTHDAPTVVSATVLDGSTVQVEFSRAMGASAGTAANYTVSGSGQGTLSANPASVTVQSPTTVDLVWNAPDEMLNGGDITITVAGALDALGGALGSPDNATDAGAGIGVAPTLDSVTAVTASPTNADDVAFTFTFSEAMAGLPGADVLVGGSGTSSSGVTTSGGPTSFTATVNGVAGDGTLTAGLAALPTATDLAGNPVGASLLSASVDMDNTPPTVLSITAPDANPTNAPTLLFTVTFSDPVSGFDVTDCDLTTTGSKAGANVLSVTPVSTTVYDVSVGRGTGSGTIRLDVLADGSVLDTAGNALATPFSSGPVYTVDELAFVQDLPTSLQVVVGDPASLTVQVTGGVGTRQYVWYYAEELAGPYAVLSTETTATLSINPTAQEDSGYYYVEVSDDNETITSMTTHLSVDDGIPAAGFAGLAMLFTGLGLASARVLRRARQR